MTGKDNYAKLSNGSILCKLCNIYYPPRLWRKGKHQNTRKCKKAQLEREAREQAVQGALSSINHLFQK